MTLLIGIPEYQNVFMMDGGFYKILPGLSVNHGSSGAVTPAIPSTLQQLKCTDFKWDNNNTKIFLDTYKMLKNKLGTVEVKTVRQMWQQISEKLRTLLNVEVTTAHCENKWRVLERSYKKFIDNQKSTGRGRKYFEFFQEMEEILGKKKSITPEILLSTDTIDLTALNNSKISTNNSLDPGSVELTNLYNSKISTNNSLDPASVEIETEIIKENELPNKIIDNEKGTLIKKRNIKRKITALEKIRIDRQLYYEKRLKQEDEKIKILKEKNELIRERNKILRQKYGAQDL